VRGHDATTHAAHQRRPPEAAPTCLRSASGHLPEQRVPAEEHAEQLRTAGSQQGGPGGHQQPDAAPDEQSPGHHAAAAPQPQGQGADGQALQQEGKAGARA
jgi:hypothetical protein